MNLTQSDIRAAREGFKYVAVRGGKRVAYCSTQQEAKREAGSRGHVVSLSGLRYTSKNPSDAGVRSGTETEYHQAVRNAPKAVRKYIDGGSRSMVVEWDDRGTLVAEETILYKRGKPYKRMYRVNPNYLTRQNPSRRPKRNPSSGAKQKARGTRRYDSDRSIESALEEQDKLIKRVLRQGTPSNSPYIRAKMKEREALAKWAKETYPTISNPIRFPVSIPSVKALVGQLGISAADAKQIKELASAGKPKTALRYADEAMNRGQYSSFGVESLYPDFPNFYYVNTGDPYNTTLYYDGKALRIGTWGDYVERKSRNPSAAGVGHAVGKHAKYAARGAKRVAGRAAKSAWAGTKSFFGSAYKSFKAHNPSSASRKKY